MTARRRWIGIAAALAAPLVAIGAQTPATHGATTLDGPARIVGEGTISTPAEEFKATVSPDGTTLLYTVTDHRFRRMTIVQAARRGNGWASPEVVPFSGVWRDGDPSFAPDGRMLLFISNRPLPGDPRDTVRRDFNIWEVQRQRDGRWGDPVALDRGINTAESEFAPSLSAAGGLYFSRGAHMYRTARRGTGFGTPAALPMDGGDPAIAPDERFLVFDGDGPTAGDADLFVSCRAGDGWSTPSRLASPVSSAQEEGDPSVSADGRTLYFFSRRSAPAPERAPRVHRATYAQVEREVLGDVYNGSRNLYEIALPPSLCAGTGSASQEPGAVAGAHELAPGVVSTGHEFGASFLPDGRTLLFTRSDSVTRRLHIYSSSFRDGRWQPAFAVGFSRAEWSDLDPAVSPDGKRLYFVSTRPRPTGATALPDMDIWYSDATDAGWGEPIWIAALSSNGQEGSPTVDRDGTICFFSDRDGPAGRNAVFCAAAAAGGFARPARLGPEVNTGPSDTSPFLAPDGQTLLFYSTRSGGAGQGDLYASVRTGGGWGAAINLGPRVNSPAFEYNPVVSRDGSTLIFGRAGRLWSIPLDALGVSALTPERFR